MRRYLITEKILAFGDDFDITDERGRTVYHVDGKVLTIRDALSFQDAGGRELATIRKRIMAIGKTYEIDYGGRTTTVHKHLFTLLRAKFTVDVPGPNDIEAQGSLLEHDYTFEDSKGRTVAEVSKRWVTIRDTYGIEIADDQDDVTILCAAIVIDRCCHERD